MTAKVLVVHGARTLECLHADPRLKELMVSFDTVISGDDPGPHWWAGDFAHELGKPFWMWCWRGKMAGKLLYRVRGQKEQSFDVERHETPKERTDAMIAWAKSHGWKVTIALVVDTATSIRMQKRLIDEMKAHEVPVRLFELKGKPKRGPRGSERSEKEEK